MGYAAEDKPDFSGGRSLSWAWMRVRLEIGAAICRTRCANCHPDKGETRTFHTAHTCEGGALAGAGLAVATMQLRCKIR